MSATKKLLFYLVYTVSATVFFLYFLFPSEAAKEYVALRLKRLKPDFSLAMDRIKPVAPPGFRAFGIKLFRLNKPLNDPVNDPLIEVEDLTVSPKLTSLFDDNATFSFRGNAYAGKIEGHVDVSKKTPDRRVDIGVNLSGIQLKNITLLRKLIGRNVSGILNGKIAFNGKDLSGTGKAKIVMSECRVELQAPLINLSELAFINIETDIDFKNQQFKINQCLFKGQQMDGKLSGTITLKNPPGKSLLNITGMIKPHHFFLADLRKSLPANLFPQKRPGSSGFPIRIMGTIEKPGFSLK